MNSGTPKQLYHTGMIYYFYPLEKAAFIILDKNDKKDCYEAKESFPVFINPSNIKRTKGSSGEKLSVTIQYDLFNEYGAKNNIDRLKKLCSYSSDQNMRTVFQWGKTLFFGFLSSVKIAYTCFSRLGETLKGEITATITRIKNPIKK